MPLQPGATFGGVLDFRPPASLQPLQPQASAGLGPAGAGASTAGGGGPGVAAALARPPVACHDVVVLLESEEVVSAECRPQVGGWRRERGGWVGYAAGEGAWAQAHVAPGL